LNNFKFPFQILFIFNLRVFVIRLGDNQFKDIPPHAGTALLNPLAAINHQQVNPAKGHTNKTLGPETVTQ